MPVKSMFATQEGPANALALNKDNNQVVIAGRNVFKVFTIEDDEFVESCNLRVGKNLNLNFSCNDVAWNQIEDHRLATAATNGAVVVWDLNRTTRSKQEYVFADHKRTVNKVSFHMAEPTWLISGSQDGTMKCFDTKTREATMTFFSNTESVRDVQFSPHAQRHFAAVSENGSVQLWDMRRPDRCFRQFTAHSGPVFACDWHPELNWLATASRDKTIKVWDLAPAKPALEFTVNTIASVGRVKWRPARRHHIASSALVVDCSVNVWDVRRPFIPFASFDQHKDVATGVAWRGDPHAILSTSRDCTLYQHSFQDAMRPASSANPQGFHMNSRGDVAFASRVQVNQSRAAKLTGMLRKAPQHSDFVLATSKMQWFSSQASGSPDFLVRECARRYVLTGRSFGEMCEHNANVARQLGRTHIGLVWSILRTLHWTPTGDAANQNTPSGTASRDDNAISLAQGSMGTSIGAETVIGLGSICNEDLLGGGETPGDKMSAGDDEGDADETPDLHFNGGLTFSIQGHSTLPQGDFVFGDGEVDQLSLDYDRLDGGVLGLGLTPGPGMPGLAAMNAETALPGQEWVLEREAFQLRHPLEDRSPPPEKFASRSPELEHTEMQPLTVEELPWSLLCITTLPQPSVWDPSATIVAMLRHHGDTLGDAQTAASVLIVLGDRRRNLQALEESTQEHWLMGYLEVLARHQLWGVATQVIKLSWLPSVNQLNQQSTTVHTACSRCCKSLKRSGWLCDRCHNVESASCSVCHGTVKGLYVWCQGCAHGGHLQHMQQWWEEGNRLCATGCGHACEYS